MPSKSEAILSSHRDAASRVTKHFSARHNLALKPNDALDVVALVLGAANWKTLRAMAENGRVPRMADLSVEPVGMGARVPLAAGASTEDRAPFVENSASAYDLCLALEDRFEGLQLPSWATWREAVETAQAQLTVVLSNDQRQAIREMATRAFTLLFGRRGTGKSLCLDVFAAATKAAGGRVLDARTVSPVFTLQGALGLHNGTVAHHAGNPMPFNTLILDERAFEDTAVMAAVLAALPESCSVVLVVDNESLVSPSLQTVASLVAALRKSGRAHSCELTMMMRQSVAGRQSPGHLDTVVAELKRRLQQNLPGPSGWNTLLADTQTALGLKFTDAQKFTLDVLAHSALTFVAGGDDTGAGATVRLFGSVLGKSDLRVYDAVSTGNPLALLQAMMGRDRLGNQVAQLNGRSTADVLLLDERVFEDEADLALLAQVLPTLKADCRIVVLFKQWWPRAEGARDVLTQLQGQARGRVAPLLFEEGGHVHVAQARE